MRDGVKVLWLDDSEMWLKNARTSLEGELHKKNIDVSFEVITDAELFYNSIESQENSFKFYDIFLIDYNLSLEINYNGVKKTVFGNDIIQSLRKVMIDVDILFYSSESSIRIRKIISDDIDSYEGVYTSNRDDFIFKACKLIQKNSRKIYELTNIRGFLANQTSENDYIVNSVLYKIFNRIIISFNTVYLIDWVIKIELSLKKGLNPTVLSPVSYTL